MERSNIRPGRARALGSLWGVALGLVGLVFLGSVMAERVPAAAWEGVAERGGSEGEDGAEARVALVTGSTSGLGREVALRIASSGAHVIVHGRSEERGREVVREIEAEGAGSATFHAADLASLDEVRRFAETVLAEYDRLDVLVNNAGVWLEPDDGRVVTEDGYELHFQVNYLSHFLLTHLLLPRIQESAPARIVNVASSAQRPIDFDDVMLEEDYSDGRAYAQSKLAQILFSMKLADELEGTEVVVTALHPATFMDTDMVLSRGAEPRASVNEGADAVMNLVTSGDVESGAFFNGLAETEANEQAYDAGSLERLWRLSAELTGLEPE